MLWQGAGRQEKDPTCRLLEAELKLKDHCFTAGISQKQNQLGGLETELEPKHTGRSEGMNVNDAAKHRGKHRQ